MVGVPMTSRTKAPQGPPPAIPCISKPQNLPEHTPIADCCFAGCWLLAAGYCCCWLLAAAARCCCHCWCRCLALCGLLAPELLAPFCAERPSLWPLRPPGLSLVAPPLGLFSLPVLALPPFLDASGLLARPAGRAGAERPSLCCSWLSVAPWLSVAHWLSTPWLSVAPWLLGP